MEAGPGPAVGRRGGEQLGGDPRTPEPTDKLSLRPTNHTERGAPHTHPDELPRPSIDLNGQTDRQKDRQTDGTNMEDSQPRAR